MNWEDEFDLARTIRDYDFTRRAAKTIQTAVTSKDFEDRDTFIIFQELDANLHFTPFCEFLKRYIMRKLGLASMDELSEDDYKQIIMQSFEEKKAPSSFEPTTTKWSATVSNWLKASNVSRTSVFLLGFGLGMTLDEVNMFLTQYIHELPPDINDPHEVVYEWCFRNHFPYSTCFSILKESENLPSPPPRRAHAFSDLTSRKQVLAHLAYLNREQPVGSDSVLVKAFVDLYDRARSATAEYKNLYNDRSSIWEDKTDPHIWTPEEIGPADIESIICSGIRKNEQGNLVKESESAFSAHFQKYRLSRQRIEQILNNKKKPSRYDLITLTFYIISQREYEDRKVRFLDFLDEANLILNRCGMNHLYPANPYEAFVMMCSLSFEPLDTYAGVLEIAYDPENDVSFL